MINLYDKIKLSFLSSQVILIMNREFIPGLYRFNVVAASVSNDPVAGRILSYVEISSYLGQADFTITKKFTGTSADFLIAAYRLQVPIKQNLF